METLLFLFPHFNFSAPEKEAYFNMFDPGDDNALTRDGNSRYVLLTTLTKVLYAYSLRDCWFVHVVKYISIHERFAKFTRVK